jgi:hypothetical protein
LRRREVVLYSEIKTSEPEGLNVDSGSCSEDKTPFKAQMLTILCKSALWDLLPSKRNSVTIFPGSISESRAQKPTGNLNITFFDA